MKRLFRKFASGFSFVFISTVASTNATLADICDSALGKGTEPGFYVNDRDICHGLSYCAVSSLPEISLRAGKRYQFFYISPDRRKNLNRVFYVRKKYELDNPSSRVFLRRDKIIFACFGSKNRIRTVESWPPQGYKEIDGDDYNKYHTGNRSGLSKEILTHNFHVKYIVRVGNKNEGNICVSTNDSNRAFVFSFAKDILPDSFPKKVVKSLKSVTEGDEAIAQKLSGERNEIEILASEINTRRPCIDFSATAKGKSMDVEIADLEFAQDYAAQTATDASDMDAKRLRKHVVAMEKFGVRDR
jgi:hypothetical protein